MSLAVVVVKEFYVYIHLSLALPLVILMVLFSMKFWVDVHMSWVEILFLTVVLIVSV